MGRIADALASGFAALMALALTLPPAWFTHVAVQGALAPAWAYAPAGLLAVVGLILAGAFLRKALAGVAPSANLK